MRNLTEQNTCGECFERFCSVCVVRLLIVDREDLACGEFRFLRGEDLKNCGVRQIRGQSVTGKK